MVNTEIQELMENIKEELEEHLMMNVTKIEADDNGNIDIQLDETEIDFVEFQDNIVDYYGVTCRFIRNIKNGIKITVQKE